MALGNVSLGIVALIASWRSSARLIAASLGV